MKFEAPVVEVKKFDVMDVLTISGETESTGEQTAAIYGLEDCGPLYSVLLPHAWVPAMQKPMYPISAEILLKEQ